MNEGRQLFRYGSAVLLAMFMLWAVVLIVRLVMECRP